MAIHAVNSGYIYGGIIDSLFVNFSQEVKVQATGKGSYKIYGRLVQGGTPKPLMLINISNHETTDTASDDNIYVCDVSGLHSISAGDVSGVTKIYVTAYATT